MEKPLISIIIPAYNAVEFIEETVNSCLNQTYSNIEIVIQDDRSTDGTWELITNLYSSNPLVKLSRNDKNLGIGGNWNAAYKKAKGQLLVIFNADDLVSPDLIQCFFDILSWDSSVDIVTGKFEILETKTKKTTIYPDHLQIAHGIVQDLFGYLYFKLSFHWNYSLVRRSLFEKVLLANGDLFLNTQVCDYELWYRCFLNDAIVYFNNEKIWGQYRKHETNNSSKPNGELKSFLKDFLHSHQRSFKEHGKRSYTVKLIRRFLTFCKSGEFEFEVFYLFIKRIIQSLII